MSFVGQSVVVGAVGVEAFLEREVILVPGATFAQEGYRELGNLNSVDLHLLQQPKI